MTTWQSFLFSLSASALWLVLAGCGGGSTDGDASAKAAASAPPTESKQTPVTDLKMDPRVVQPCFLECKAKHPTTKSDPAYMPCFDACSSALRTRSTQRQNELVRSSSPLYPPLVWQQYAPCRRFATHAHLLQYSAD